MKPTNFASSLSKFFTIHLPSEYGCTPATIDSYRQAFMLFLTFMEKARNIPADRVQLCHLTRTNILSFLDWLQKSRHNGIATRNQRQSAINSFVKYLMYEHPDYLDEFQRIVAIPIKKAPQREISYMKTDGVKLLMEQVDPHTHDGLRDYVMLSLLYSTGIRVSELIQIQVKDLSLFEPYTLLVHGKGQKSRYVPIMRGIVPTIQKYLLSKGYDRSDKRNQWLFESHMHAQFTRQGVHYLVRKYAKRARAVTPELIPEDFSPHTMRHTTAMGLVDAGVDLIYIRDLLGHVSVRTTETYAKADVRRKREAIEAASMEIVPAESSEWDNNKGLKEWLRTFNRT